MTLKELRIKRGLTQQQLAEKVGMTRAAISKIESGINAPTNMTLGTAIKLGDALKVSNLRKLVDPLDDTPEENDNAQ